MFSTRHQTDKIMKKMPSMREMGTANSSGIGRCPLVAAAGAANLIGNLHVCRFSTGMAPYHEPGVHDPLRRMIDELDFPAILEG